MNGKNININDENKYINHNIKKHKNRKKFESDNEEDMDEIIFQKGNKRKKLYKKKEELVIIPLTTKEIEEYLHNKNPEKKSIIKNTNNNKIKTKFLYSYESKNFIYYSCFKK